MSVIHPPRLHPIIARLGCGLLLIATLFGSATAQFDGGLPDPFLELIAADHHLPRLSEAHYQPLGRSPVVDAVLGDPLYLPSYGRQVSGALRDAAASGKCERLLGAVQRAGGLPMRPDDYRRWLVDAGLAGLTLPGLDKRLGPLAVSTVNRTWQLFLLAKQISNEQLRHLSDEERTWLRDNAESYFFGEVPTGEYAFFTDNTDRQLETFKLAARLDLAEFGRAARCLAYATDLIRTGAPDLRRFDGRFEFVIDSEYLPDGRYAGTRFVLAGPSDDLHREDADLLIDIGGDDIYTNNAGGTRGLLSAAMLLDLGGNDRYEGDFAVQGAGFLGVGALCDLRGDDFYQAASFSQGAAWCGASLFVDQTGADEYRADFFAQGAAAYGSTLFWEIEGSDLYSATGMAQAASTTLGIAFLVESAGNDRMRCGWRAPQLWTRAIGVGQGGAVGMRDYPWKGRPAFYGGVAFLYDSGGDDDLYCPLFCQGGAYMLGAGILVAEGGNDRYTNQSNGQGAVIHLAAGLMIDMDGDDIYTADWGSTGVGGDRGVGIFIDGDGDDIYRGGAHNIGTARKPKAVGLFVDMAGDDSYDFSGESCGRVQHPADPEHWPTALFMDLGGSDLYPSGDKALARSDGGSWSYAGQGFGLDLAPELPIFTNAVWRAFPARPRIAIPFNPIGGWQENLSHRALPVSRETYFRFDGDLPQIPMTAPDAEEWYMALSSAGYERRRQIYEELDLLGYAGRGPDRSRLLSLLLSNPASAPGDLIAWASLRAEADSIGAARMQVSRSLLEERVDDPELRRLLIRMLGTQAQEIEVLRDRLVYDLDALCRREAAFALARSGNPDAMGALSLALEDSATVVRLSICSGLRESEAREALSLALALIEDDDLFVRRQAALSAVSLGHKQAIPRLLRELSVATLDTGENYGKNLFADLGRYVGKDLYDRLGVDREAWLRWWREDGADFDLTAAIASEIARRDADQSP